MNLRLVTPGTETIVSLTEAKAHLRIFYDDDDEYITALASAAQDWLTGENNWLGRSVVEQGWELTCDRFPRHGYCDPWPYWRRQGDYQPNALHLPKPPLKEVTGLFYTPSNGGVEVEITDFRTIGIADANGAYLLPAKGQSWPMTDCEPESVRVEFTAGYAELPPSIKHAALLMVGHWYENREAVTTDQKGLANLPLAVDALLAPYRSWPH
ncbi:head-tail connector protein [Rhizobium rhizogenes]|uniref:head-tail connector protein n=1 Tax=Rhizobium rhizogenes TaxID=359 RepID=UPI0015732587|nr:head-tail connector protein [Rhizobium rhizogenes]NTF69383.1 phage gp6-like head-tail connector protein [Rhizobium rhizogenes]